MKKKSDEPFSKEDAKKLLVDTAAQNPHYMAKLKLIHILSKEFSNDKWRK